MVIIDGLYILRFLWGMWWESEGDGDIGIRMANRGGVCGGTEEGAIRRCVRWYRGGGRLGDVCGSSY